MQCFADLAANPDVQFADEVNDQLNLEMVKRRPESYSWLPRLSIPHHRCRHEYCFALRHKTVSESLSKGF